MSKTYWEKLKDPRWQRKRLEALQAAEFSCQICYDETSTLHVHHKQYFKGREPWEYETSQLSVLCESCHSERHGEEDPLHVVGSFLPMDGPRSRDSAAALIAGFAGIDFEVRKLDAFAFYAGVIASSALSRYGAVAEHQEVAEASQEDADGMWRAMLNYARSRRGG